MLGVIQEQRRDFDESAAAFERAVYLSPQTPRMHGALGRTFALSGRKRQALDVLRKLEEYAKERYVSPLEFAWIQFALGETELGFKWLAKAGDDRTFDILSIKVDPRFDPFRDDRHRISPMLLWQPSHFSRIRLQYNHDRAAHLAHHDAHSVWLGFEFLIGAHAAHKY